MLGTQFAIPILNKEKSAQTFCLHTNHIAGKSGDLAFFKCFGAAYLFYTGREHFEVLNDLEALNDYMASGEQVFVIMKERTFKKFQEQIVGEKYVLVKDRVGHRIIALISNKPDMGSLDWGRADDNL